MIWQEMRELCPEQWVLIEAIEAYTEGDHRICQNLSLIGRFNTELEGWTEYSRLHKEYPKRELFVLHTRRTKLEVKIRYRFG
jgi:hypothetical protein